MARANRFFYLKCNGEYRTLTWSEFRDDEATFEVVDWGTFPNREEAKKEFEECLEFLAQMEKRER